MYNLYSSIPFVSSPVPTQACLSSFMKILKKDSSTLVVNFNIGRINNIYNQQLHIVQTAFHREV